MPLLLRFTEIFLLEVWPIFRVASLHSLYIFSFLIRPKWDFIGGPIWGSQVFNFVPLIKSQHVSLADWISDLQKCSYPANTVESLIMRLSQSPSSSSFHSICANASCWPITRWHNLKSQPRIFLFFFCHLLLCTPRYASQKRQRVSKKTQKRAP